MSGASFHLQQIELIYVFDLCPEVAKSAMRVATVFKFVAITFISKQCSIYVYMAHIMSREWCCTLHIHYDWIYFRIVSKQLC